MVQYYESYLSGVFNQWNPERQHCCPPSYTSPLASRSHLFIPVPPNLLFAWRVMLRACGVQSVTSPRLASMGTTSGRLLICLVRAARCCCCLPCANSFVPPQAASAPFSLSAFPD